MQLNTTLTPSIEDYLKAIYEIGDKVKGKIEWMYNRISSSKAKEYAKAKYLEAINKLN